MCIQRVADYAEQEGLLPFVIRDDEYFHYGEFIIADEEITQDSIQFLVVNKYTFSDLSIALPKKTFNILKGGIDIEIISIQEDMYETYLHFPNQEEMLFPIVSDEYSVVIRFRIKIFRTDPFMIRAFPAPEKFGIRVNGKRVDGFGERRGSDVGREIVSVSRPRGYQRSSLDLVDDVWEGAVNLTANSILLTLGLFGFKRRKDIFDHPITPSPF